MSRWVGVSKEYLSVFRCESILWAKPPTHRKSVHGSSRSGWRLSCRSLDHTLECSDAHMERKKKLRESAIQIRVCLPQLSVGEWATHLNPRRPTQRTGPGGWTTLLKALMPTQKKKTARKDAPHMVVPGPLIILVCRSLDHTLEGYDDAHTRIFKKCAKARSTFAAPWTSFVGPT